MSRAAPACILHQSHTASGKTSNEPRLRFERSIICISPTRPTSGQSLYLGYFLEEHVFQIFFCLTWLKLCGSGHSRCPWCCSFARSEPQSISGAARLVLPCSRHGAVSMASSRYLESQHLNNHDEPTDTRCQDKTPEVTYAWAVTGRFT